MKLTRILYNCNGNEETTQNVYVKAEDIYFAFQSVDGNYIIEFGNYSIGIEITKESYLKVIDYLGE